MNMYSTTCILTGFAYSMASGNLWVSILFKNTQVDSDEMK